RCVFIRSQSNPPPSLASSLDEDREADQREESNASYVALTRAREQSVFSRTQPRGQGADSWWQRSASSGAIDPEQVWQVVLPEATVQNGVAEAPVALSTVPASAARPGQEEVKPAAAAEKSSTQQSSGQVVHRVSEWLTPLPVSQRTAERIERAMSAASKDLLSEAEHHGAAR
ncbi:hypothetical protein OY671_010766, partial [Metschnikowia pulcherrima]